MTLIVEPPDGYVCEVCEPAHRRRRSVVEAFQHAIDAHPLDTAIRLDQALSRPGQGDTSGA